MVPSYTFRLSHQIATRIPTSKKTAVKSTEPMPSRNVTGFSWASSWIARDDTVRYLPFFAPYLLRLRLRPSTPSVSSVPRTMW